MRAKNGKLKITMFRWQRFNLVLAVYGLLVSISAFMTALIIFQIPSDQENSIIFGLSLQRLALLGVISFVGLLAAGFAVKAYRDQVWAERIWVSLFGSKFTSMGIILGAAAGFALGWFAFFTPLYRYGNFKDYFVRLHPFIGWITFISALTFVLAWGGKHGFHRLDLRTYKKTFGLALIVMTIFALIWILIASTGLGLRISEDYWYGTGVPILGMQIVFAFALGICVLLLERSYFSVRVPAGLEFFIFVFIWGIAACLWVREPLHPSYFAPGPYLPDFQYHPYSDAVTFDLASQFALIGQGINNGVFFDRALYMGFLVFLHALAGQDYSQVVALQAAIYAVFPGILYLLGKEIHSRTFGVILAVLAILRGLNGIAASTMIDLANQKQMLTDFPIAILLAWLALMLVRWLKAPNKNYTHAIWVGGIAGLAVMLRTHALFSLVFAILLCVIVYWNQKLRGLFVSVLLITAMFASILPWGIASGGSVIDVFMQRIRTVIEQRYGPNPPTPIPSPEGSEPPSFSLVSWDPGSIQPHSSFEFKPQPQTNSKFISDRFTMNERQPLPLSITTNFFHNLVTSVFILPASPVFHDLRHTLKDATPFWRQYWDGSMQTDAMFFFLLDLLLIALGIGIAWRSVQLAGLAPLGIFLFHNLANALARTSGGRYIVPVDWVVFLYFALGLLQIILWGMKLFGAKVESDNTQAVDDHELRTVWDRAALQRSMGILLFFLLIGSTLPLSEMMYPRRYPLRSQAELFAVLESKGYLTEMGFDPSTLKDFSEQQPAFRLVDGRALYPRFYLENTGESKKLYPYQTLGFPRIGFIMIGPNGVNYVVLPKYKVRYFPNASDVIVLGCQDGQKIDALAVVVIDAKTTIHVREPSSPLQCPLPVPVCDGNGACR
jgi:hypothetical protein